MAACAAASGLFSPTRRAIMAVAAMPKPIATEYTSVSTDSVKAVISQALFFDRKSQRTAAKETAG